MRSIQWMTIATLTLLLCGCPPTTEPDEDMGGREDMGQTPDMNTPDEDMAMPPGEDMATEPDMGGDVDMKVEEDMRAGPLMLDCAGGRDVYRRVRVLEHPRGDRGEQRGVREPHLCRT